MMEQTKMINQRMPRYPRVKGTMLVATCTKCPVVILWCRRLPRIQRCDLHIIITKRLPLLLHFHQKRLRPVLLPVIITAVLPTITTTP